jgi:hypothetical protein
MRIGYARVSTTDQGRRCQAGLLGYWQLTRRGRALIGSIIARTRPRFSESPKRPAWHLLCLLCGGLAHRLA